MNKKDILLASACVIVIGGCVVKVTKAIKRYKQLQEETNNEEMVYENGQ
jgi:hypothetical protein